MHEIMAGACHALSIRIRKRGVDIPKSTAAYLIARCHRMSKKSSRSSTSTPATA